MKKQLTSKSAFTLSLLFILFFATPFIVSFVFGYQTVVYYLASLLLLMLTWLLYKREGRNLTELGLQIKSQNMYLLPLGIFLGILFFGILFFAQMLHNGIHIQLNKDVDYLLMAKGVFILLPSVLGEEMIFRGYCFKKTIDYTGTLNANLIFAFFYIVWHWIALDSWGNYGAMLGLITTGFGHVLFSTALLKSGTLYFPIGIHLGNNWASHNLFSSSTGGINTKPSNDVFFIPTVPLQDFSRFHTIAAYLITFICSLIFIWIIWKWRKKPGVT